MRQIRLFDPPSIRPCTEHFAIGLGFRSVEPEWFGLACHIKVCCIASSSRPWADAPLSAYPILGPPRKPMHKRPRGETAT